jgi:hypothetical protein
VIRAVLDTNVYVAALLSRRGAPARLVAALHEGLFDALTCPKQLAELTGVLARPKIARHVSTDTARDFVAWLERVAVTVPDPGDVAALSPDPDDDYLIALALIGRARVIVSGGAHLLQLKDASPPVISPAEFALLVEGLR